MNDADRHIMTLFGDALEYTSQERAAFLDRACPGDPELRARVEALLGAHDEAGRFLAGQGAPPDPATTAETACPERSGTRIGPYSSMASLVNRRTASLDDFCSRLGRYNRNLWTPVLRPRRNFRTPVSAARLHQTALQDQSHPAVCLGRVAAGLRRRVLETYACPTPANQSEEIALRRGVSVRTRLDARAALGRSSLAPISALSSCRRHVWG